MVKTRQFIVKGRVQGVGFRYFVYRYCVNLGLRGYVKNLRDGNVEVVARGEEEILNTLYGILKEGPHLAIVKDIHVNELNGVSFTDFDIRY
ncbi:MAG: acylphosphatase [Candidatus Hydrogenedentota bacterium]